MVSPRNENRAIASLFAGRGSRSSHLSYIFTTDADVWAKKGVAMAEAAKRGSGRGADQGLGRVDGDAARFLDEVEAGPDFSSVSVGEPESFTFDERLIAPR